MEGNLTDNGTGSPQPAPVIVPGVGAGSGTLVVAPETSLTPPVVVGLPWSPGGEVDRSLATNLPALLLTSLSLSDLAGPQTLTNHLSDSGGTLRIQRETSLSFVVGGVAPVGVEPEDGAESLTVHEGALLPGLDHDQARLLVDPLAGGLGENQRAETPAVEK